MSMSFFSNHSQHTPSTETTLTSTITSSQPHPVLKPRSQTSQTSLRSSSKHLSLSVSSVNNDPKERERNNSGNSSSSISAASNGSNSASFTTSVTIPTPKTTHITPLRSTWVFWFRQQRAPSSKITNYEEGIKKVTAFSSVESFWCLQTHLIPPSSLVPTTDYLLFHSLVRRPVWEDPLNASGGKWIIRLRKGISDRLWEDLLLAVIGDQFLVEDGLCGCVLSVRGGEDILSVWNKDDKDAEAKARIRDTIRRTLALPPACIMEYKSNNDSIHDKSSFRTNSSTSINTLNLNSLNLSNTALASPIQAP